MIEFTSCSVLNTGVKLTQLNNIRKHLLSSTVLHLDISINNTFTVCAVSRGVCHKHKR